MNDNISFRNGPVLIMEGHDSENYHMHDNATELIWVLDGEAGITFNNKEYILSSSDDLMLIVAQDFHKVRRISNELHYLSFYINLPLFEKYIKDILHVGLYLNPGYKTPEQLPYIKEIHSLLSEAEVVKNGKPSDSMDARVCMCDYGEITLELFEPHDPESEFYKDLEKIGRPFIHHVIMRTKSEFYDVVQEKGIKEHMSAYFPRIDERGRWFSTSNDLGFDIYAWDPHNDAGLYADKTSYFL